MLACMCTFQCVCVGGMGVFICLSACVLFSLCVVCVYVCLYVCILIQL